MAGAKRVWDDLVVAVSVLLVDDPAGFRASARSLLELDGFRVVGEVIAAGQPSPVDPLCYEKGGLPRKTRPLGMEHLWSRADANPRK